MTGTLTSSVANYLSNSVGVILGDGAGHFDARTTYAVRSYCGGVALGTSTMTANSISQQPRFSATVAIFLNDGNGTFQAAGTYSTGGGRVSNVTAGDFNGDGHDDVAIGNLGSGSVGVLLGDGLGGFQPVTTYATGGSWAAIPALADLNGDGNTDLVINDQFSHTLAVLWAMARVVSPRQSSLPREGRNLATHPWGI